MKTATEIAQMAIEAYERTGWRPAVGIYKSEGGQEAGCAYGVLFFETCGQNFWDVYHENQTRYLEIINQVSDLLDISSIEDKGLFQFSFDEGVSSLPLSEYRGSQPAARLGYEVGALVRVWSELGTLPEVVEPEARAFEVVA